MTVGISLLVTDVSRNRGGRPKVIDEVVKAQLVALLGTGLSIRHAAALLRIGQSTVSEAIAADEQFKQEIADARLRAELLPLQTIIRDSRRSWRAAVWLMKHLRVQREADRSPAEEIAARADSIDAVVRASEIAKQRADKRFRESEKLRKLRG
jgi:hypothetical protein